MDLIFFRKNKTCAFARWPEQGLVKQVTPSDTAFLCGSTHLSLPSFPISAISGIYSDPPSPECCAKSCCLPCKKDSELLKNRGLIIKETSGAHLVRPLPHSNRATYSSGPCSGRFWISLKIPPPLWATCAKVWSPSQEKCVFWRSEGNLLHFWLCPSTLLSVGTTEKSLACPFCTLPSSICTDY